MIYTTISLERCGGVVVPIVIPFNSPLFSQNQRMLVDGGGPPDIQ